MTKRAKISNLIEERQIFIKRREDSWNEDLGDHGEYAMEEPKEIDLLADEIKDGLLRHRNELPVDFILESLTSLGDAPQVIYDDNGNWAISSSGMSPVVMSDSGKFEDTQSFTSFVEPEEWYDTIREALNHYLKED